MKRACFPEETSSTSLCKRVNEIKAEVPSAAIAKEGIGANRRALISEGCKPCFLFSYSVEETSCSLASYWFSPFSDTTNENVVSETEWILGANPPPSLAEKGYAGAPVGSFSPPLLKTPPRPLSSAQAGVARQRRHIPCRSLLPGTA